jgi:hypothetical protein
MQDELVALSSERIHRVVDGATHESLLYDKRDSQVTSAAIEQVVDAVRTSTTDPVNPAATNVGAQLTAVPKGTVISEHQ